MDKIFEFCLVTQSLKVAFFRHKAWIPGLERKGGGVPCEWGGALVQAVRHFHWQVWPAPQGGADRYTVRTHTGTEAEFLGEIRTKVLRVFLLAIHRSCLEISISTAHATSYSFWVSYCKEKGGIPPTLWFKKYIQKPQVWELSRLCPETSTKFYVHEFGFCTVH